MLVNLSKEEKALEILNLGLDKQAEPNCLLIQAKDELETKLKEKKLYSTAEQQQPAEINPLPIGQTNSALVLRERKRLSIEPNAMITYTNRLTLSSKQTQSLKESTTPKENLLIKSSGNRQGFEILEEDSEENRQSSSNDQQQVNTTITIKKTAKETDDQHATEHVEVKATNVHQNSKVKQNLIEKLRPLEEPYKEPKIVIFENLKPNQKFYADLKRVYADNTEYSFEEIRMRKMKKMTKQNRKRKESQPNSELIKEIEMLKAKIKENEERDKVKESLQNQVDILKKQIEMIIANSITTQQGSKRYLDEVDCGGSELDKAKRLKLSENKQLDSARNRLRELTVQRDADKELTIVRDLWNGTFASQYGSPAHLNQNQSEYINHNNKGQQQTTNQRNKEQFSIFKDPTTNNLTRTNDFSYYPQMYSTTATQDCFTIALPRDPSEFNAKLSSTPAMSKRRF